MTDLCDSITRLNLSDSEESSNHFHFMCMALLAAQRSKDPVTQVGACIAAPDGDLIATGYNGMPRGCHDDVYPWGKNNKCSPLRNKGLYVCHAEMNALANACRPVHNCTIYVTLFPCNECSKLIIQNGIREVVYLSDKKHDATAYVASRMMLDSAGVKYWRFRSQKRVVITLK